MGNYINPSYTSSKFRFHTPHSNCLTKFPFSLLERQILLLIGKHLVESAVRRDPVTCAEKEQEGKFNFDEEMAKIEAAIQQQHGPTREQQEKQAQA